MTSFFAIQAVLQDPIKLNQVPKHSGDKGGNQFDDEENMVYSIQAQMNLEEKSSRIETRKNDGEDVIDLDQIHEEDELPNKQAKGNQFEMTNTSTKSNRPRELLRDLKSMSSSILDDNYFKEDTQSSENLQIKRAQADLSKIKNYFMKFRMGQFFEFLVIHLLYFSLLGPLLIPFLRFRGKFLAKNLMLYGWNLSALFQFLFFFINITNIIFFFNYPNSTIKIEIELINNVAVVICRCVIIACKYATFDPLKIEIIRNTSLTTDQIFGDFFLTKWKSQTSEIVGEQIYQAQRSYDIDPGLFYVQFITDPEKSTHDRIMESDKIVTDAICKNKTCKKPTPIAKMKDDDQLYCGYSIIYDIIRVFENRCKFFQHTLINTAITVSFLRAVTPIVYNFCVIGINAYKNWHEYYIAFTSALQVFSLYYVGCQIMIYGLIDMMRKLFMLRQLTFMIAPRKLRNLEMKKLYPTLNIFRSVNLKGWSLMRQVCMEYGKPYLLRVQGFFFFLGIWVSGNLAQIVLYQYKVITQNPAQMIQNYLDLVYTLSVLFAMLVTGAKINNLFEIQENILNSNKTIVTDLLIVGKKYIQKQKKSLSFIYNKAIEKVIEVAPDEFLPYVINLINQYDNHIEELVYDSDYNPFTLFGIKVTFVMLQSVIIAVGSIAVSIISSIMSNN